MMRSAASDQRAAQGADSRKHGQRGGRRSCRPNPSDVTTRLCRGALQQFTLTTPTPALPTLRFAGGEGAARPFQTGLSPC